VVGNVAKNVCGCYLIEFPFHILPYLQASRADFYIWEKFAAILQTICHIFRPFTHGGNCFYAAWTWFSLLFILEIWTNCWTYFSYETCFISLRTVWVFRYHFNVVKMLCKVHTKQFVLLTHDQSTFFNEARSSRLLDQLVPHATYLEHWKTDIPYPSLPSYNGRVQISSPRLVSSRNHRDFVLAAFYFRNYPL